MLSWPCWLERMRETYPAGGRERFARFNERHEPLGSVDWFDFWHSQSTFALKCLSYADSGAISAQE